jgi:DNA-binding response OmpR family regulator
VASLLQRGLERDGYSVDVAVDGNEALALGLENTYVAIVLDVMIPSPTAWPSPAICASTGRGCRS